MTASSDPTRPAATSVPAASASAVPAAPPLFRDEVPAVTPQAALEQVRQAVLTTTNPGMTDDERNQCLTDPQKLRRFILRDQLLRPVRGPVFQHISDYVLLVALFAIPSPAPAARLAPTAPLPAVPSGPVAQPLAADGTVPVFQPNGRPAGDRRVVLRDGMPTLSRADRTVVAVVPHGLNSSGRRRHTAVVIGTISDGRALYRVDPTASVNRKSSSPTEWLKKMSLRGAVTALLSVIVALVLLLIFQPQVYLVHLLPRDHGLAATLLVVVVLWFVAVIGYKAGKSRDRDYDNI